MERNWVERVREGNNKQNGDKKEKVMADQKKEE